MAKDPVCGMYVDENTAELKAQVKGVTYYFCAEACLREFVAPEKELKNLKMLALASVLFSIPILMLTYLPLFSRQLTDYFLFVLDTPVQFGIGWRFYRGTYDSIKNRMGNMDVLVALGTSAAWAYSAVVTFAPSIFPISGVYFDTSAIIITLILGGRFLEHLTKNRASEAVRKLADLQPSVAHRIVGGAEIDVPVEQIKVGDTLIVRPGEKVPVDAVIVEGRSTIDESMITGESIPVEKSNGNEVIGATINKSGLLTVRAEKVGQDTTLSQILKLVEEAQVGKAQIQRLADRVASIFVPSVILAATVAGLSWYFLGQIGLEFSLLAFVSVVVISCPCALGIATPAALLVGTSKGAQNGVLIKGGEYLELAGKINTVVFDKTGTLTVGEPSVTDVVTAGDVNSDDLLRLAASVERGSEHPLAEAIVKEAVNRSLSLSDPEAFEAFAGKGVGANIGRSVVLLGNRRLMSDKHLNLSGIEGHISRLESEGKTTMVVAVDSKVEGVIAVADTVKPSARSTVEALKRMGIEVVMLTGDNARTAGAIARVIGIDRYIAEVLPQQKEEIIESLQKEGRVVAMVGDGINDAPALAKAQVGIAVGSGTDIAKEAGGIVLIKEDLKNVSTAIRLSRKTLAKIKQNLFWAFAYNAILIPVAAGALVPFFGVQVYTVLPFLAAGAMAISSVTVVGNSLTLFKFKPDLG
jgi:Cu+-exporting ATPase